MTSTSTITRPVATGRPGTAAAGRRTAALVASGILMVGIAVGTTYAVVAQTSANDRPQLPAVQRVERAGADAKAFARGTAPTDVIGYDTGGADALSFARHHGIARLAPAVVPALTAADASSAEAAMAFARQQEFGH